MRCLGHSYRCLGFHVLFVHREGLGQLRDGCAEFEHLRNSSGALSCGQPFAVPVAGDLLADPVDGAGLVAAGGQ
ncbi:hypothetical protein ACFWNH_28985 [Rhodococcus qingshengii]|uniref:hypothetical protein n=1 Tax=Rhodococcus qingshengii TaxID=334542 RepID=UPI00365079E4